MRKWLVLGVLLLGWQCARPQGLLKGFFRLGGPEQRWAITHPFKAPKAYKASRRALAVTDSLHKAGRLPGPLNGGKIDAFRHTFWLILLCDKMGPDKAYQVARAHEASNYRNFRKQALEEEFIPDHASAEMDFWNNSRGVELWADAPFASQSVWIERVLSAISEGVSWYLPMNSDGQFMNCEGQFIPQEEWEGKWLNDRCLAPTDQKMP